MRADQKEGAAVNCPQAFSVGIRDGRYDLRGKAGTLRLFPKVHGRAHATVPDGKLHVHGPCGRGRRAARGRKAAELFRNVDAALPVRCTAGEGYHSTTAASACPRVVRSQPRRRPRGVTVSVVVPPAASVTDDGAIVTFIPAGAESVQANEAANVTLPRDRLRNVTATGPADGSFTRSAPVWYDDVPSDAVTPQQPGQQRPLEHSRARRPAAST